MRMQRFVLFAVLGVVMAFGGTAWAAPDATIVAPTTFAFPATHRGSTATPNVFQVRNSATGGGNDLSITSFTTSGTHCTDFSVTNGFPIAVPANNGASDVNVNVSFTPLGRDARGPCTFTAVTSPANPTVLAFTVSGIGTSPNMSVNPGSLTYADTKIGVAAATRTFTVTNSLGATTAGDEDLTFGAMVTTLPTDYALSLPADLTLAPGETSGNITVTFVPSLRLLRTGQITVTGNDSVGGNDLVNLSGTGTAPTLTLTVAAAPLLCGSAKVTGTVGTTSTCTFTINNTNPSNEILDYSIDSSDGQFTTSPSSGTVAIGGSQLVTITFNPTATGTRSSTITVTGDTVPVTAPFFTVNGTGTQAVISLSPDPLDIGNVHVTGSATGTAFVDNTGTATLTVTSMIIEGPDAARFSFFDHNCTGQSCTLSPAFTVTTGADIEPVGIRCSPNALGPINAVLRVVGDQEAGINTLDLDCNGVAPNIVLSRATVPFGDELVGAVPLPTETFTIRNTGTETLSYTIAESGDTFGVFSVSPTCATTCTTNTETDTFTVTFTPGARQSYSATLTIGHNDPDAGVVTVQLTGTGIAPVITSPPVGTTIQVGSADLNVTSTPAAIITITNGGDAPLDISSVGFVGGQLGEFAFTSTNQGIHSVGIGQPDTYNVVCTPTVRGTRTTTLRINSNNLGDSTFDITLNCTGLEAVFSVTPASLNFGPVPAGTTSSGNKCNTSFTQPCRLTITNTGNKAGNLTSITSTSAVYALTVSGGNVPPQRNVPIGGSVTVDVAFSPVNGDATRRFLVVASDSSPASQQIPLDGDGITQGVDISVGPAEPTLDVDLGDLRVGVTSGRLVTVQNSGDTAFTLAIPTSDDAHCQITLVSPTTPNWPITVFAGGATATFNINVTPTAVGSEDCTITVTSNIPPTGTSDPINFTFNGVAPGVEVVDPPNGMLGFGGVDIDAGPLLRPVEIRNPGTFLLTIASCAITGPNAARFSIPACPNVTVLPGESTTMMVSYDPTVEALDTAQLTFLVDALGVPNVQIPLDGIGLDQRLDLPALLYEFPDTFRNPVTPPEIQVVVGNPVSTVTNTGAPLTVSMAVVDAADAALFVVTDAGPFTVQPGTTIGVPVEFRPVTTGIFETTLTIHNDATGMDMGEVTLRGTAIERMVNLPGRYDLGVTGVGIPVLLTEVNTTGVVVQSLDPDNDYTIDAVGFVDADGNALPDGGPFRIVDDLAGQTLSTTGTLAFDVEFVAEAPGRVSVFVGVYLDGDPNPHGMRTELIGEAVDVEIQGGGCQAGRDPGWAALLVVGLGLMLRRRHRRHRASMVAGLIVLVVAAGAAAPARAEPTRNVEISTFVPAPATEVEGFGVESPLIGVNGAWALGLAVSYATDVLTMGASSISDEVPDPITTRTALQLGFAYAFLERFEAGVRLPLYQQSGDDEHLMLSPTAEFPNGRPFTGLAPAEGTALGDAALHLKAQAVDTGQFAAGGSAELTVPTGTDGEFAGVDGVSGHLRAIAGLRIGRVGVTGNVGFIVRGTGDLGNIRQGNSLSFGAGARFRAIEQLWVVAEAFGTSGPGATMNDGTVKQGVTQLEGVAGVRYEIGRTIGVSVGGGRGIVSGAGAPAFRGFLLIDVAPRARQVEPLVVTKPRPPRDTRDDDSDGIANADDQCATDAEDGDGYMDDDGCPEADNDEDGLLDGVDKCPIEAEDLDGTTDGDGCVDPDNDGDGIFDVDDKCPNEAEDKDGHMDNDGCDEPDNDADGIPDVIDQCALEAETINGNADDDGCPDNGDSLVMIMPDRIEIFEPVTFTGTTATLTKKSANVLGQVAATLRANRDFKRVRVTVHVHPRGNGDDELSRKRAKVVRDWLVQWGIEPERVEDKGLGSTRPLVPKAQKGAAGLNDRVEFIILEKEVGGK